MPLRFASTFAIAALLGGQAFAHDFWIEPETYNPQAPGAVALDVLVGHGEDMSDWPVSPSRIIGLRSIGPDGLENHANGPETLRSDISLELASEGQHLVFIETTNSFSSLPAQKFNSYLKEEGIVPIEVHRATNRLLRDEGLELYSRRGKALIQVGCPAETSDVWKTNLGLTLEIIPLVDPFQWNEGDSFPVELRFHGALVPNATLKMTNLDDDSLQFRVTTNAEGQADISGELSEGRWLVHNVWAEPVAGLLEDADYQTVFSSLTFQTETDCSGE
ncbi:DUF4198 domain-containing protein [Henriciella litoralis]|uniref:DUF4198 domain-containing protein n=1 Tax=Henriciella litoralis TaxID=568102 RepID=UPI0009FC192D|nr:DUF4198 domain-containing protein [Henriciella litoralis]